MIDVDNLDPIADRSKYALALAESLDLNDETTIGPTDAAFIRAVFALLWLADRRRSGLTPSSNKYQRNLATDAVSCLASVFSLRMSPTFLKRDTETTPSQVIKSAQLLTLEQMRQSK